MPHALELQQASNEEPDHRLLFDYTHTANVSDYRVDKNTGEVYGQYLRSVSKPALELVNAVTQRPRATSAVNCDLAGPSLIGNVVYADFNRPPQSKSEDAKTRAYPGSRRGPKPKVRSNPHVDIIKRAVRERVHWIENAVMAGMYIAVEGSNGRLNIKPSYLQHVITMPVISTEKVAVNSVFRNHDFEPVSERYVRYLASAGRVAVGHIEHYLEQHPEELTRLQDGLFPVDSWSDEFDLDEAKYSNGPV